LRFFYFNDILKTELKTLPKTIPETNQHYEYQSTSRAQSKIIKQGATYEF